MTENILSIKVAMVTIIFIYSIRKRVVDFLLLKLPLIYNVAAVAAFYKDFSDILSEPLGDFK